MAKALRASWQTTVHRAGGRFDVPLVKPLLLFSAIALASLLVTSTSSESCKVAAVAAVAAIAGCWLPALRLARRDACLLGVCALAVSLSTWLALEPRVAIIGSVARAQGGLLAISLLPLCLLASATDVNDRRMLVRAVAVLASFISLYTLLQYLGIDPWVWRGTTAGRPAATLSNATTLAGWLLLTLPPSVALLIVEPSRRWLWGILTTLQAGALLTTGTRSAVLALVLVGVATAMGLSLRASRLRMVLLLVPLGALLLFALAVLRPQSLQDRALLWRGAAGALIEPPALHDLEGGGDPHASLRLLVGYGPDQQQPVLAQARTQTFAERPGTEGWDADRAHQWLLDRLLEAGLIGVLVELSLFLLVARTLLKRMRGADGDEHIEAMFLGIALGAWFVHLQVSFPLTGDRTLAWIWIGLALAVGRVSGGGPAPLRTSDRRLRLVVTLLLVPALLLGSLTAGQMLAAPWQTRYAPALAAEQHFLAGQRLYAQALAAEPDAAAATMKFAAGEFAAAAQLRTFDRDAALAAASAWVEAAADDHDRQSLAAATRWSEAALRVQGPDARWRLVQARIDAVAATLPAQP
jgi:drug/metabolite transporter superfamily protein YnfA